MSQIKTVSIIQFIMNVYARTICEKALNVLLIFPLDTIRCEISPHDEISFRFHPHSNNQRTNKLSPLWFFTSSIGGVARQRKSDGGATGVQRMKILSYLLSP